MRTPIGQFSAFFGLVYLLMSAGPAAAADLAPPRVKPVAESTLDFKAPMRAILSIIPVDEEQVALLTKFAFSSDGKTLAGLDMGGKVTLWDPAAGKPVGRFGSARARCFALSPDGKKLVTVSRAVDYSDAGGDAVELWDVAKDELIKRLDEGANRMTFTAVAFSPDGRTLALGAAQGRGGYADRPAEKNGAPAGPPPGNERRQRDYAIHLWDAATGEELRQIDGPAFRAALREEDFRFYPARQQSHYDCMLFSPDGRTLALVSQENLYLWEVATGKERGVLQVLPLPPRKRSDVFFGEPMVNFCLACAPDGRKLALGGPDGLVRQWDLGLGRELPPLIGHQGPVRAVGYSPDGKALWSLGWDAKLYTWPTTGAGPNWKPPPAQLTEPELQRLWQDLGSSDPLAQYAARQILAAAPQSALPFLRKELQPVPAADAGHVQKLVETLIQHQDYNERRKAAIEVRKLGEAALPALHKGRESMQLTNLAELIEEDLYASPDHRRKLAAVQVLETIGTEEAGKLLSALAGGAAETRLARQAKAAQERLAVAPAGRDPVLETLWADLAGEDARKALFAARALTAVPDRSVPFLRDQFARLAARETFEDDPRRIAELIDQLDSDNFATRENASKELGKLGPLAAPALRRALEKGGSAELKRRLEELLRAAEQTQPLTEKLRAGRAFEVLEQVGTPEARGVCEAVAKSAKNTWLRESAADALKRMGR
jgi:WD40 repeat protein